MQVNAKLFIENAGRGKVQPSVVWMQKSCMKYIGMMKKESLIVMLQNQENIGRVQRKVKHRIPPFTKTNSTQFGKQTQTNRDTFRCNFTT